MKYTHITVTCKSTWTLESHTYLELVKTRCTFSRMSMRVVLLPIWSLMGKLVCGCQNILEDIHSFWEKSCQINANELPDSRYLSLKRGSKRVATAYKGFFLDGCESFLDGLKKGSFHCFHTGVLLGLPSKFRTVTEGMTYSRYRRGGGADLFGHLLKWCQNSDSFSSKAHWVAVNVAGRS